MRRRGHPCGLPLLRRGQRGRKEPTRQEQATFGCLRWRVSRCRREQALARRRMRCSVPMPLGFGSGGCKGRSPLHKKTKKSPPSRREERSASAGLGDGGRNKAKGGASRRQGGQATAGDSEGGRIRCHRGHSPPPKNHLTIRRKYAIMPGVERAGSRVPA